MIQTRFRNGHLFYKRNKLIKGSGVVVAAVVFLQKTNNEEQDTKVIQCAART